MDGNGKYPWWGIFDRGITEEGIPDRGKIYGTVNSGDPEGSFRKLIAETPDVIYATLPLEDRIIEYRGTPRVAGELLLRDMFRDVGRRIVPDDVELPEKMPSKENPDLRGIHFSLTIQTRVYHRKCDGGLETVQWVGNVPYIKGEPLPVEVGFVTLPDLYEMRGVLETGESFTLEIPVNDPEAGFRKELEKYNGSLRNATLFRKRAGSESPVLGYDSMIVSESPVVYKME